MRPAALFLRNIPSLLGVPMRSKLLNADPSATYAVIFDTGDEVAAELGRFVRENDIEAASITAIGAFSHALLGYFDWEAKQYRKIAVGEQVEVLSLLGDVAVGKEGPALHLHAVLGKSDGQVMGGHLLEGHVRPTLEVILTRPPGYLRKRHDPVSGLALISVE
jgi:predicted DNA-binding protein with PD1-like motif